jgi:membrane protein YqaA with SNARE-associated domain
MLIWTLQTIDRSGRDSAGDSEPKRGNVEVATKKSGGLLPILLTVAIVLGGIIFAAAFKEEILRFGERLLTTSDRTWVDVILFFLTAVSSTPLALPVWVYAVIGAALGMHIIRLAAVMAVASASGSLVTLFLGRYFGNSRWVRRRFPRIHDHPWTKGKSRAFVTLALFLGTASPIPCDILFVACGAKKYPPLLFWITMIVARFIHYLYIAYGFTYFQLLFDYLSP